MSHEILYSRAFVKTSGGIIPMIQAGSSNCTEFRNGREVLERRWFAFDDEMIALSPEDIMVIAYSRYGEEYEYFESHGKYITNIPEWFRSGIRAAGTLEQYALTNPHLSLKCWIEQEEKINSEGYEFTSRKTVALTYCRATVDLDAWIVRALQYVAESSQPAKIYFDFCEWDGVKPAATYEGPVIVKAKNGYIKAYETNKSITYTRDASEAVVFSNPTNAVAEIGDHWGGLSFVKAGKKSIEKPFAIYIESGSYCGSWVRRVTARNMSFAYYPQDTYLRFKSEADAQKYITNKLMPRFGRQIGDCIPLKIT